MVKQKRPRPSKSKWQKYEQEKAQVDPSLSSEEYDKRVRALAKKFRI